VEPAKRSRTAKTPKRTPVSGEIKKHTETIGREQSHGSGIVAGREDKYGIEYSSMSAPYQELNVNAHHGDWVGKHTAAGEGGGRGNRDLRPRRRKNGALHTRHDT